MSVLLAAQLYSPAQIFVIDIDDNRLSTARTLGATTILNPNLVDIIKKIKSETGDGVDVAIEAVGNKDAFDFCQRIVKPGGHISVVGVHGQSVDLQLQSLWSKNIPLTTGLVNTNTAPLLLKNVTSGKLEPKKLITHWFTLDNILEAYDVFKNAGEKKALKVIITPRIPD